MSVGVDGKPLSVLEHARLIIDNPDILSPATEWRPLLHALVERLERGPEAVLAKLPARSILDEAEDIIWGEREKTYGAPAFNLETIAEFWNIWLKRRHNVVIALMPEDICHMMVLLKMARLLNDPTHRDSLVDGAGYLGLVDRINQQGDQHAIDGTSQTG